MRETLTFLAGLLLVLLVAALFGPAIVDWRDYREAAGRRLSVAAGMPVEIAGEIGVRLLPTPRLKLSNVRIGNLGSGAERAGGASEAGITIEQLDLEFSPGALLRGELRLIDARAEGAVVVAALDPQGGLALPASLSGAGGATLTAALDNARISRSEIRLRQADGGFRRIGPVSLALSAPQLAGPWRIEGEVAGQSVRIVTGEPEALAPAALDPLATAPVAASRTRTRMTIGTGGTIAALDGFLLFERESGRILPGFEGALIVTLADEEAGIDPMPGLATVSGRVKLSRNVAEVAGLTIATPDNALRLEGESRLDLAGGGPSSLTLRTRRLVPQTALEPVRQLLAKAIALDGRVALPDIFLRLDADQVQIGSEETGETSLRGRLGRKGLTEATLGSVLAGARLSFAGAIGDLDDIAGTVGIAVTDTRRLALAMGRMGLDARLADAFSGLGTLDLRTTLAVTGDRIAVERAVATVPGGRLEASGTAEPGNLTGRIRIEDLDLGRLPELTALGGGFWPREVRLELTLPRLRAGAGPSGEAQIEVLRRNGIWQPGTYAASGFGGLTLTGRGETGASPPGAPGSLAGQTLPGQTLSGQTPPRETLAGRVRGRIASPQADVLIALAGPFLPADLRQRLAGVAAVLSPVALDYGLERKADGAIAIDASGTAGRTRLQGTFATGTATAFDLDMSLPERALVFQQAGLPRPASDGPGELTIRREAASGRLVARLAGPGFAVAVSSDDEAGFDVSAEAAAPGLLLPASVARQMPEGGLAATARLTIADDVARLGGLVVRVGGASATGQLALSREGAVTGSLTLPSLSLQGLTGLAAAGSSTAGAIWSSGRFLPPAAGPPLALALQAPVLRLSPTLHVDDVRLDLIQAGDGLTLDGIAGRFAEGGVGGRLAIRRDGGLVSLSGQLTLEGLAAERVSAGEIAGRLSGRLEFGGAGESPARMVAGLGGSGELVLADASIARLDPSALARVVAATSDAAAESDVARLGQRLLPALATAPWPVGSQRLALTMAAGVLRLQPVAQVTALARAEFAGSLDLRSLGLDARALLSSRAPVPAGWQGGPPQLTLRWRGPLASYRREIDPAPLSNALAARALAREIERVEAFESDVRERSFFARRLRAEREMREAERQAAEFERLQEIQRILDEQKQREAELEAALTAPSPLPPSPIPLSPVLPSPILPSPLPSFPPPGGAPLDIRPLAPGLPPAPR